MNTFEWSSKMQRNQYSGGAWCLLATAVVLGGLPAQGRKPESVDPTAARERLTRAQDALAATPGRVYSAGGLPKVAARSAVVGELFDGERLAAPPAEAFGLLLDVGAWDAAFDVLLLHGASQSAMVQTRMTFGALSMPIDAQKLQQLEVPESPVFDNPVQAKVWHGMLDGRLARLRDVERRGQPVPVAGGEIELLRADAVPEHGLTVHVFVDCGTFHAKKVIETVVGFAGGEGSTPVVLKWHVAAKGQVLAERRDPLGRTKPVIAQPSNPRDEERRIVELFRQCGVHSGVGLSRDKKVAAAWGVGALPTFVVQVGGLEFDRFVGWDRSARIKLRSLLRRDMNPDHEELAAELRKFLSASRPEGEKR